MTAPKENTNDNNIDNGSKEILACFSEEDIAQFHTGKIDSIVSPLNREIAHKKKVPHIICRIYAFTIDGKYLIQRRSGKKIHHSGLFTDSASGHIHYHENFSYDHIQQEAARELEEEMGTTLFYSRLYDIQMEKFSKGGCELAYNFVGIVEDKFSPDPIETHSDSGFKTKYELKRLLNEKKDSFVRIAHKYWSDIIQNNTYEKILTEYKNQAQVDKDLQNYIINNFSKTQRKNLFGYSEEKEEIVKETEGYKDSEIFNSRNEKNIIGKYGVFIGRFQPFHKGHLLVILNALTQVEHIKIGIGSSQYANVPNNPFSYEERKKMVKNTLLENNIHEDNFSIYPVRDTHDITIWIPLVLEIMEPFSIFFGNDPWTRQLFLKEGKTVAPLRKFNFKIYNGSFIRKKIAKGNDFESLVPAPVDDLLKKIDARERLKKLVEN